MNSCKPISRRSIITGLLASAIIPAAVAPAIARHIALPPAKKIFRHGVASGDPDQHSVILWTRVTTQQDTVAVAWQLSSDQEFKRIVASGSTTADAKRDHCVKILASGLVANMQYFYRFKCLGEYSTHGRTKVLPDGPLDRLTIALVSCSNYPFGFFNAYDHIAADPQIDFVFHAGDYLYEYGAKGWGHEIGEQIGRIHQPANDIVSLADYRQRHAQYKSDAGSQAMLSQHPLMACWDDHESANNPWLDGAQNHDVATQGSWADRRAAAIQSYYEWMPIREPQDLPTGSSSHSRQQFWRSYSFGDLATLVTLETRHSGRAKQIDYDDYRSKINTADDAATFKRDVIGAADRAMLSAAMEQELQRSLSASVAAGQRWRLIGSASTMARTLVPDVVASGIIADPSDQADPAAAASTLAWKGKWNLPFYTDTWDGYPHAREGFYALCREAGARDILVMAGDSHSFWANELYDDGGGAMGLEIGTAGVTSPGDFIESGFDPQTSRKLDLAFAQHNGEVRWTDNFHQGYVRLTLTKEQGRVDYWAISDNLTPTYQARIIRSETIGHVGQQLRFIDR